MLRKCETDPPAPFLAEPKSLRKLAQAKYDLRSGERSPGPEAILTSRSNILKEKGRDEENGGVMGKNYGQRRALAMVAC